MTIASGIEEENESSRNTNRKMKRGKEEMLESSEEKTLTFQEEEEEGIIRNRLIKQEGQEDLESFGEETLVRQEEEGGEEEGMERKRQMMKGRKKDLEMSEEEVVTLQEDERTGKEEKAEGDDMFPDGGWGWIVVFGASLILVLVDSVGQCFGIIFSKFLLSLETPTTVTAWIFNLFSFFWCLTGPSLGPLIDEFGWRKTTFFGSFLLVLSIITSAFATAAWVLFFTYSLLAGMGYGIISTISYMIVPHYFKKRRGFANGIIMAWDCGGQLIAPPFIRILQDQYGYKGATLILGGIVLHCFIGAAVFHPVEWHLKRAPRPKISARANDHESQPRQNPAKSTWRIILRLISSTAASLVILKSIKAVILSLGSAFIYSGYLNFLALVPFAIQEAGHSLDNAAVCVSVSAVCNMITRVIVATMSDSKWFNFQISMIISCLTISGAMVCFTLTENLVIMKLIMGLWGCGVGIFMSLYSISMVHYMGLDNYIPTMGVSMLCVAFAYLTAGPFAGYIRDATQSYEACIRFLSGVVFMAFVLWMFMPLAIAHDQRHWEERKKTESRV